LSEPRIDTQLRLEPETNIVLPARSDFFSSLLAAVEGAFGGDIDYAMLLKH